jgi:hypothetical protein
MHRPNDRANCGRDPVERFDDLSQAIGVVGIYRRDEP